MLPAKESGDDKLNLFTSAAAFVYHFRDLEKLIEED
jgi:hypothetical protein